MRAVLLLALALIPACPGGREPAVPPPAAGTPRPDPVLVPPQTVLDVRPSDGRGPPPGDEPLVPPTIEM